MELDHVDREILRMLQRNARTPFSEIAREIDMASATVHDRVGRLEDEGVIRGYHADVDPKAVGYGISALVGLRVEQGREQATLERLAELPQIQEIHLTTGEWDLMMRVHAGDADGLRELMFKTVAQMEGFSRSQTMVILGTEYESHELALESRDVTEG